ncbi:pyocin knob domain-containing protein [Candidatus Pantoea bituminis]|uniref:pyocin knob domain-containing protein n=1 Tax=Candidatus Pantoea bituminis TaxID=2831036 RepID=UPI001C0618D7|nr:pyocin knob domain-containing protein [Pantoea bituminis]
MAWYTTGTIAVSGTTVTGTGTNWLDNKQSIGAGQALLIPGSGTVKIYEIASVTSATKLTLKTSPGTIAAGQAYAILSFYTDSVPDFARRLAAQLSYYQSQMDGWQQIMTGAGNVTLTAPDGTSVTISSLSKLTADIASAYQIKNNLSSSDSPNSLRDLGHYGVSGASAATTAKGYPVNGFIGTILVMWGPNGTQQSAFHNNGTIYTRYLSGTWNGSDGPWTGWAGSYGQNNKPSAVDVGALPISGGALTGKLTANGGIDLVAPIYMGTGASLDMNGKNINSANIISWVSATAAKASAAAMGFTAASGNRVQIPVAGGFFIIQMYTTVITANSNGDATISYPLAFTALGAVMACSGDFDAFTGSVTTRRLETTSFDVRCRKMDGSVQTGATRINWIATGFLSA